MLNSLSMKSKVTLLLQERIIPPVVTKEKFTFSEEMVDGDMKIQYLKIYGSSTLKIVNGNLSLLKKIRHIPNLEPVIQCLSIINNYTYTEVGITFKDSAQQ